MEAVRNTKNAAQLKKGIGRTLIIANGPVSKVEIEKIKNHSFDSILCIDGGLETALSYQLKPNYVVGDFDSQTHFPKGICKIYTPDQNKNDLEKALEFISDHNPITLTFLGVLGGRTDHTLVNLSVLSRFSHSVPMMLVASDGYGYLIKTRFQLSLPKGKTVSLIPLPFAEKVVTSGLKYPLKDESLNWGQREGLSNESTHPSVSIELKKGLLLAWIPDLTPSGPL